MSTSAATHEQDKKGGVNAYATLLTRPSYLAGATLLAYSLYKYSPATPLIILYTPETLPEPCVHALKAEASHTNAILYSVEHQRVPISESEDTIGHDEGMVAERFVDTWTKLRVFEVLEIEAEGKTMKIDRLCFLDADMMVFQDPSPLIFTESNDVYLDEATSTQSAPRLCATHTCVCNLDGDAWAPTNWTPQNCAYTHLASPDAIAPVPPPPAQSTLRNFNSGAFFFHPSSSVRTHVLSAFTSSSPSHLRALKFPDQDFLNEVFDGRWQSLNWRVNALKTWRYWHANIWRDDQVAVLHYIVDKPWAARGRQDEDGKLVAGYKGDDGVTHGWWWEVFEEWKRVREEQRESGLVETVGRYVAGEGGGGEGDGELRAIGGGAQEFARKWQGKEDDAGKGGTEESQEQTHGPVLRKKMLGERGHGPVVRNHGWSFMSP